MIHYKKDTDHIVTLTFDMKDRPLNVINHEIGEALGPVIDHLKKEKARGVLKGVILTSAKKTFLAGGDLEYIYLLDLCCIPFVSPFYLQENSLPAL